MSHVREKPLLFSYFRSSCSWRVRLAMALKGVDYDYQPVHLLKGEQRTDDYKRLNPLGQVPTLVTEDGRSISQSVAIMEYLEERYAGERHRRLLPTDPAGRAKVREIVEAINAGTQPVQNLSVMNMAREAPEERREWARFWIEKGLTAVEELLKKSAGKFCVGNEVSLADCCLVPQVFNAQRFNVDVAQFQNIQVVLKRIEGLDGYDKAHPKTQPDCPPELR